MQYIVWNIVIISAQLSIDNYTIKMYIERVSCIIFISTFYLGGIV